MSNYHKYFMAALACFVLAGSTGAFLRFGVFTTMAGLDYANVRHAHSHLMSFAWATPAIIALFAAQLPRLTERPPGRGFRFVLPLVLFAGLSVYVPFLLYGYKTAAIGGANLPLAAMAATLNVLVWYLFALIYFTKVWRAPKTRALWLMNASVFFMLLATGGILAMPALAAPRFQDPVFSIALTHIFLYTFLEGWFVPAILALAYATLPDAGQHRWARLSGDLLVLGLPFVFLLYMPVTMLTPSVRLIGSIAGLLVVLGTMGNVVALWRSIGGAAIGRIWRAPLVFLVLKSILLLAMLAPIPARMMELTQMRVVYLHTITLGVVTLGLFAAAQRQWAVPGRRWMVLAVTLLILSLIPLTGFWPLGFGGMWTLQVAAWAALGPVVVAIGVLVAGLRKR